MVRTAHTPAIPGLLLALFLLSGFLSWTTDLMAGSVFGPRDFMPVTRGGRLLVPLPDQGDVLLYRERYALIVGVSGYRSGWRKLPGVKQDVVAVREVLQELGFRVGVLEDPSLTTLESAIREFISRYGLDPENGLLLYFAGHGYSAPSGFGERLGYFVPADAPLPDIDPAGFEQRALPLTQIEVYARQIRSKHALFVFDACFSGTVFSGQVRAASSPMVEYRSTRPVRQFIAAGQADEAVPDQSIFRQQLVAGLRGEADSGDGFVTGEELGVFLMDTVIRYSRGTQHPQVGKLRHGDLDKGDFIFALPDRPLSPPEDEPGTLFLNALPAGSIRVNERDVPQFPVRDLRLQAGLIRLTFLAADGRQLQKDISLKAGEVHRCVAYFDTNEIKCKSGTR